MTFDDLIRITQESSGTIAESVSKAFRAKCVKEEKERILLIIDKFFAGMLDEVTEDLKEAKLLPPNPQHVLLETVRRRLKAEINLDHDKIDMAFRSSITRG